MGLKYQYHYSQLEPKMFSTQNRRKKALKIVYILKDFLKSTKPLICLEIGCSAGRMTRIFGQHFKRVLAIDIDKEAIENARKKNRLANIKYQIADALNLPFKEKSFDVVICNNVYEHLPDPFKMMREVERVLKRDGVCYFAGPNKYTLIEPHYFLPFLSWLPKNLSSLFLRITGKADFYYETLFSYSQLRRLTAKFRVYDYTMRVLKEPKKFQAGHPAQALLARTPTLFLEMIQPFLPSFFWILAKKKTNEHLS